MKRLVKVTLLRPLPIPLPLPPRSDQVHEGHPGHGQEARLEESEGLTLRSWGTEESVGLGHRQPSPPQKTHLPETNDFDFRTWEDLPSNDKYPYSGRVTWEPAEAGTRAGSQGRQEGSWSLHDPPCTLISVSCPTEEESILSLAVSHQLHTLLLQRLQETNTH